MKVTAFLTDGFETVEALAVIDICRRAGIDTDTVSITGDKNVISAQNIPVKADYVFDEVNLEESDLLFLPGGPGHKSYMENEKLLNALKEHDKKGKRIAAICAAPSILGRIGLLKGKKATCFPGFEKYLPDFEVVTDGVVVDGKMITGKGPGVAVDFALEIVARLCGQVESSKIRMAMQCQ